MSDGQVCYDVGVSSLPLLGIVVALSGSPVTPSASQRALDDAVHLFQSFEDAKAAVALRELLRRSPPQAIAAKAHIYLGMIALNASDEPGAKAEFEKAVATSVLVDMPPGQSPKAQILFAEARRSVAAAPLPAPSQGAPPAAEGTPPAALTVAETPAPSHVPAYVVGGIGIAALAAGGIFGYLQQQAQSSAVNDPGAAAARNAGQPYAQDGITADVLFGVGGVALVTAIVLFFTEGSSKAPAVAVSAGPGGFAISGAF